ncbi:pre-mRNA-splicing factor CWC25 homolog, partial [Limulus polyphemus]|uniref:Pre-mRNA-splicing factor CWC25 homolog n=1 Tax=Limulus polyphemus TaxID=6850 RepID=A0ABM1C0X5_LIMPO
MGGGDLNLKKSWHPSTLRNIERVWKAEQQHEAEQKKIEQLQKELEEERAKEEIQQFAEDTGVIKKKQDRLDWMYQGPAALVNREDYLMGRHVDKTFEILQQAEEEKEAENRN